MITAANFKIRFPEFDSALDARVELFIQDTLVFMGEDQNPRWLNKYDLAQAYLTAHLMAFADSSLTGDTSAPAPIKKQDVDGVIIESAIVPVEPTLDEYYSTIYGKRYVLLRSMVVPRILGV